MPYSTRRGVEPDHHLGLKHSGSVDECGRLERCDMESAGDAADTANYILMWRSADLSGVVLLWAGGSELISAFDAAYEYELVDAYAGL